MRSSLENGGSLITFCSEKTSMSRMLLWMR